MTRLTERRVVGMSRFDLLCERCLWVFVGALGTVILFRHLF